ncbi:MAG TPA: ABC transporter substrate-binding protein, partial [Rikenellaceae bacterium]|nr:ABC transporter substrate-binding protein [Rikenellaceae bacterium]
KMLFDLNQEWLSAQGFPIPQTALMVKASVIRNNPALVEEVLDAYERSVEWVNGHPDSAAVL